MFIEFGEVVEEVERAQKLFIIRALDGFVPDPFQDIFFSNVFLSAEKRHVVVFLEDFKERVDPDGSSGGDGEELVHDEKHGFFHQAVSLSFFYIFCVDLLSGFVNFITRPFSKLLVKIQLASGMQYKEGYVNLDFDKSIKADKYHDLNVFPYPFEDDSADEILASHVIEHLDDPQKFLQECHRILKPGASIFVHCPIGGTWSSYHVNHKYNMTPYSFMILQPTSKWAFQFSFHYKIKKMSIFMPLLNERVAFPWRLIYANCFVNNIFTKMKVELVKV